MQGGGYSLRMMLSYSAYDPIQNQRGGLPGVGKPAEGLP
jgi:hypothetical protein